MPLQQCLVDVVVVGHVGVEEVVVEVPVGIAEEYQDLELQHMNFQWNKCDYFMPTLPVFAGECVGTTCEFPDVQHKCDYFLAFLHNELVDHIVTETNRYNAKCAETHDVTPGSHEKAWVNLTRD